MLDVVLPTLLLALLFVGLRNAPSWLSKQPLRRGKLSATYRLAPRRHWVVERDGITLSASTTALNPLPKEVMTRIEALGHSARDRVKRFYDAGVAFGMLGTAIALAGAVWAWMRAWWGVWHEAEAHARTHATTTANEIAHVIKRSLTAAAEVPQVHASQGGLQPLIPGITTPFSHLPTLILAFLLSQLLHELGHALAAAIEDISPSKLAFSIHLVLPSASVVFPSNVDYLPVRARSRIATSGPWHNLLLWVALLSLGPFGRGIFYANRTAAGRIVTDVASGPLAEHFRRGDLITHIDDIPTAGKEDVWTRYLTTSETEDLSSGWCISKWEFADGRLAPCADHLVAFQQIEGKGKTTQPRCLEPHSIVAQPITQCKCAVSQICIRPAPSEHILRIRYRRGDRRDTVLWAGDRAAVYDQVRVSILKPLFWSSGTQWVELFMAYLKMATLSLYLINLLPLPHTDGIQLFSALLSSRRRSGGSHARQLSAAPRSQHPTINPYRYDGYDSDDSDAGDPEPSWAAGYGRREEIWQRRLRRVVEGTTAALVVGWALGWAMLALLRSS